MAAIDKVHIPVTFVNLYTRRRLARTSLPALTGAGDKVYLSELGYEVVNCEWTIRVDSPAEISVVLRPLVNAEEQRPFSYEEEE
jgi:hypothetical protein